MNYGGLFLYFSKQLEMITHTRWAVQAFTNIDIEFA